MSVPLAAHAYDPIDLLWSELVACVSRSLISDNFQYCWLGSRKPHVLANPKQDCPGLPRFSITSDSPRVSNRSSTLPKLDRTLSAEIRIAPLLLVTVLAINSPIQKHELYNSYCNKG